MGSIPDSDRAALLGAPPPGSIVMAIASIPMRLVLGGVFILAGYSKLFSKLGPRDFHGSIGAFKLDLPPHIQQIATFATPWVELIAAAALILGFWTRAAALIASVLMAGFIGLYISVLARGINLGECGCFGDLKLVCRGEVGICHILQNGVLLLMALFILASRRHVLAADQLLPRKL